MKLSPLWTETAERPKIDAQQPSRVNVAVIGSGYTGLHAALSLADEGASVAVFETNSVGWGASTRNGGMVNPGLKLSAPELFRHYGADHGSRLWQWSMAAIDFVEGFVNQQSIDCSFRRHGQVVLAYKPQHFTTLCQEVQWHLKNLNDSIPQIVGPSELAGEIGSPGYFGGVRDPRAAGLHPAKYLFGIARVAQNAGVLIIENAPVTSLRKVGSYFSITTEHGPTVADYVLLATNGYTNNLLPDARNGIFSGGSYIITTEPLAADLQQSVSPQGRMFYDTKHFLNYFRLTPDGRMLFGGRHNLSTDLPLEQSAVELRKHMIKVFPQLRDAPLSHSWTGKLGLTFDMMPHAGRLNDQRASGVFYAYGYGGHGVGVASYLGHVMGKQIAGKRVDNPIYDLPHARYFFTPYEKYYLPLVSAWFRFLDAVS